MIVEDDIPSAAAMAGILRRYQLEVSTVATVAAALANIERAREAKITYDFIVLDLMLPDGNGSAILRHVNHHQLGSRVCVVTAASDTSMIEGVRKMNPDCILCKPIDMGQLLGRLDLAQ